MIGQCLIQARPGDFELTRINACAQAQSLLAIEVEMSAQGEPAFVNDPDQLRSLVDQARELGAELLVLVGEALHLSPTLDQAVHHARQRDMRVRIQLSQQALVHAQRIANWRSLGVELSLVVDDVPDFTTGQADAITPETVHPALAALRSNDELPLLDGQGLRRGPAVTLEMAINRTTVDLLEDLWDWARDQGIEPALQMPQPRSAADLDEHSELLPAHQVVGLIDRLTHLDRRHHRIDWQLEPVAAARACQKHQYACYVSRDGVVYACAGVTIPLGDLHHEALKNILKDSEVLENLRDFQVMVKSPCGDCQHVSGCYGCRGSAMMLTQDYLSPDPMCVNVKRDALDPLPRSARELVPHGPSIRMIDRLLQVGEREMHTEFTVPADSPFVDEHGELDDTAYVEIIAQSLAAAHGFHLPRDDQHMHKGLLLGVKALAIQHRAKAGQTLSTRIRKMARLGDFGIAEGVVRAADNTVMARGEIKVWMSTKDPEQMA